MTMQDPIAVYWAFFEALNRRDAEAWADVMSYSHVRVSPRGPTVYATSADYVIGAGPNWERMEKTGWHHTVGVEPRVVHAGDDQVHLAGGWTRYDADDRPILRNRVTYILTRQDGPQGLEWGIRARFGIDSVEEKFDEGAVADRAQAVVGRWLEAWGGGQLAEAAASLHEDCVVVGPRGLRRLYDAGQAMETMAAVDWGRSSNRAVTALQVGARAANVAVELDLPGGGHCSAVAFVARDGDVWALRAFAYF